jgi:undecaprenyl-diphosphatase
MEIIAAAILGIVQGLTEFLPISSSAHLIIVPWLLGWKAEGLAFDVSLHVGTALAVIAFFWKDWIRLAREFLLGIREWKPLGNADRRLAWLLIVGTLPAVVAGLAFEDIVEKQLRSPLITVFTLAILAGFLYWAEKRSRQNRTIDNYTWADSVSIGLSQAIALIPGVSRSGITMTAAMLRDSTRTSAARFSFLLSTPVIVGAGMLEVMRLARAVLHPTQGMEAVHWDAITVGFLCAAISGFFCIRLFLRYLQTKSFTPFVVYRILLAGVVLAYYLKFS